MDWGRFTLYTPLIRKLELKLRPGLDDIIHAHWIAELLYLPARPPFFPHLTSLTIDQEVIPSLPLLPMLVTNALQSLEIIAGEHDDWHEELVDEHVEGNLPLIQCCAPYLQSFRYQWPVGSSFFHRLTLLKNIACLELDLVNPAEGRDLTCLGDLPRLRKVHFTSLEPITALPSGTRSPGGARGWPSIRVLKVTGTEMLQAIVSTFLHANRHVEDLHLEITRGDKPTLIQRMLAFYLGYHTNLESVHMSVWPRSEWQRPWPEKRSTAVASIPSLPDLDIETSARSCFASASNIKAATFEGTPQSLWRFMSSVLQKSIGGWKCLVSLTFNIDHEPSTSDAASTVERTSNTAGTFPGLSFLANTIWLECPRLEVLEFQFDQVKLMDEELSRTVKHVKSIAPSYLHSNGHPLRELTVNAGTVAEEGNGITFNPDRKIEIVAYLEELFPRLTPDALRGTPGDLWSDMGTWLQTYRKMKARVATGR